jgi:hypothetical protein
MSLIVTDQLQESRVRLVSRTQEGRLRLSSNGQKSRVEIVTSAQIQSIQGRLIFNLQAARSSVCIALLNNQSNS